MTDERIAELLTYALQEIDEDEYPQIVACIYANMDEDTGFVYTDALTIATQLHDADGALPIPESIVDFLFEVYEEDIEDGNATGACNIGSLYYSGRAGEQNYEKAVEYYTIAAQRGERQAQENLGYCYYYGRDVEVDYEKAFHYFSLGAFDGHIRSLYKIGDMYKNGYYVEKNLKEAFYIYKRCAETLTEEALPLVGADVMMRLGDCYFKGLGTEVNYLQALKHYQFSEQLFFERLKDGDFMIKGCYEKVIRRQAEVREKMLRELPEFDWVE